jgi:thioredoxin-related protein
MQKKLLTISAVASLLLLLSLFGQAQDKGVHFEHELSWTAIQAKARAENKYIFMDCFTTWCGPCKYMSSTVFPQEECGNFFNDKFVCVKVQLDTSANDNEKVKSWYQDGHDLMQLYHVNAFPTFLVFAPDGHVVHRLVGGDRDAKDFIVRAKDALDPDKQYYTLLNKYKAGQKDSAFLRRLAEQSVQAYDVENAKMVAKAYFATQKNVYTQPCLELMDKLTTSTKDEGFAVFLHHSAEVDKVLGKGKAEKKVNDLLTREYVYPKIFKKDAPAPDWNALQTTLAAQYPAQAPEIIEKSKVIYFQQKGDWEHFQTAVVSYMKKYGDGASPEELNEYAWTVFQKCPDMNCVTEALEWSKRSFKDNQSPGFMDTYANILYKMGKKDDAIAMEEKAISLADEATKTSLQPTLDKMKKGEKTWD